MARIDDMAARLPQLYRDGELVRGMLGVPAVQLEILDEEMREVRIAHWFATARTLDEVAKLAAILDFVPEPWQDLELFRSWVETTRDAILRDGSVTPAALQRFLEDYLTRFEAATGTTMVARIDAWEPSPSNNRAAFVETPQRRRTARPPPADGAFGGIEPLAQFSIDQKGLDETVASFLLTGLPSGPEAVPVIVNLTTAQALVFLGSLPVGQLLAIRAAADGTVTARLEGIDVTDRLRSVEGVIPGTPWTAELAPARAIKLSRGQNDLWFLPVAHYDLPGLDRFLLALPDLNLKQGRFDSTDFDKALFAQDAAMGLRMTWLETAPATFDVTLPAGAMLSRTGNLNRAQTDRETVQAALDEGVGRLKAAGVASSVRLVPFSEIQLQTDRLTGVLPIRVREVGPTGADRLPDAGGVFEVTPFDSSTFR
jgi:hypothetical protein